MFIGSGVKRKWLEKEVKRKRTLNNMTILEPKPRSEQKLFLNACDVGLVTLVKEMRGVAMPSRTYNFLAAGKPVLALTEEKSEVAQSHPRRSRRLVCATERTRTTSANDLQNLRRTR